MLLHLGGSRSVPASQVVAFVDLSLENSRHTQALLQSARSIGRLRSLGEPAKALVILCEGSESFYYLSPLSVRTLARRMNQGFNLSDMGTGRID